MTSISHEIYYRTAQYIKDTSAAEYEEKLDGIKALHDRGGFTITNIHCDNEFHKTMDSFAPKHDPPIKVNFASAREHVPQAERNNWKIQEWIQSTYCHLPFNHLPRIMIKYVVMESCKEINFYPAKHGVLKYFSPRMILYQENIDCNRVDDCRTGSATCMWKKRAAQ